LSTKTGKWKKAGTSKRKPPAKGARRSSPGRRESKETIAVIVGLAVVALAAVYWLNRPAGGGSAAGSYAFAVGSPGPGELAPPIQLASTQGGTFDLASAQGKTVLLYFQEGLTCQPCWDQLVDIESSFDRFQALGIDQIVTITTDPLDAIRQKVSDEGITTPVLSDLSLAVSRDYQANSYGMMGGDRDGHSFVLIRPDGTILWRADYGGPPDFTMYLPVDALLADLRKGVQGAV
jgi:peroxiredoxin